MKILDSHEPEDMPIWARLALMKAGVPFSQVTHFDQYAKHYVTVFLNNLSDIILYKD